MSPSVYLQTFHETYVQFTSHALPEVERFSKEAKLLKNLYDWYSTKIKQNWKIPLKNLFCRFLQFFQLCIIWRHIQIQIFYAILPLFRLMPLLRVHMYHSRSKQRTDQRVLVLTLKFLALKKLVFWKKNFVNKVLCNFSVLRYNV